MILGIDAGGTHTRFMLFEENGNILNQKTLETMHFMKVGYQGIEDTLRKYAASMNEEGYNPENFKVAIGIAGYGQDPKIRENIARAIHNVFPNTLIFNDAEFAHIAALQNEDGIFVISGTGSIALQKTGTTFNRTGGFGYLLDDAGSAFWIGKRVLETFVRQVDGRDEKTALYTFIKEKLALDNPYEIIQTVFKENDNYRNYVANIAGLVKDLDDVSVKNIFKEAGYKLAELANAFEVKEPVKISIGGSVLLNNETVQESFIKSLNSNLELVYPEYPVEYAAYTLYK